MAERTARTNKRQFMEIEDMDGKLYTVEDCGYNYNLSLSPPMGQLTTTKQMVFLESFNKPCGQATTIPATCSFATEAAQSVVFALIHNFFGHPAQGIENKVDYINIHTFMDQGADGTSEMIHAKTITLIECRFVNYGLMAGEEGNSMSLSFQYRSANITDRNTQPGFEGRPRVDTERPYDTHDQS
jgi:hypothetical protein